MCRTSRCDEAEASRLAMAEAQYRTVCSNLATPPSILTWPLEPETRPKKVLKSGTAFTRELQEARDNPATVPLQLPWILSRTQTSVSIRAFKTTQCSANSTSGSNFVRQTLMEMTLSVRLTILHPLAIAVMA